MESIWNTSESSVSCYVECVNCLPVNFHRVIWKWILTPLNELSNMMKVMKSVNNPTIASKVPTSDLKMNVHCLCFNKSKYFIQTFCVFFIVDDCTMITDVILNFLKLIFFSQTINCQFASSVASHLDFSTYRWACLLFFPAAGIMLVIAGISIYL